MSENVTSMPLIPLMNSLGLPYDARTHRLVRERLAGHVTNAAWLPSEGPIGEALAGERSEHLRLLTAVREIADRHAAAEGAWREEDADRDEALRSAVRDRRPAPGDDRTALQEREHVRAKAAEQLDAAVAVLAEHVEDVIATVRAQEDEWLAALADEALPAARAAEEEAARLLAEARAQGWAAYQTAMWIRRSADDGPFGQAPAPVTGAQPPPSVWQRAREADFRRHFTETRPWNADHEPAEAPVSWQELSEQAVGDPTGRVEPLDAERSGAAA